MDSIETLKKYLEDKDWRILSGNLYFIKDKKWNKVPFIPNESQLYFYKNRHKKNIILKARQLWFTTLLNIIELDNALFSSFKNYWIIAQDINASTSIFDEKIKFAFDNLPIWLKELFKLKTDRKWEIKFENNTCSISVDTSFRSSTLQSLHISEYWKICHKYPEKAREIQTWALNTLSVESECFIESTAEGNSGYFYEMTMKAIEMQERDLTLGDMDYKFFFFPWFLDKNYKLDDDNIILTNETKKYFDNLYTNDYIIKNYPTIQFSDSQKKWYQKKQEEQGDDMLREYPSFPLEAFDLAIKGSYYEKELWVVRRQNRIWKIYHDERLPVYTAWDIWWAGWWDETAIWFFQIYWKEIRLIDYWEGNGYSMVEIINNEIKTKNFNYKTHYFPHDAEVHEYSLWNTRISIARQHLGNCEVLSKLWVSDWIESVRNIFWYCFFNDETCTVWLKHLSKYRREFDEKRWIYRNKPLHDNSSNCADAFRYLAVAVQPLFKEKKLKNSKPVTFHNKLTWKMQSWNNIKKLWF